MSHRKDSSESGQDSFIVKDDQPSGAVSSNIEAALLSIKAQPILEKPPSKVEGLLAQLLLKQDEQDEVDFKNDSRVEQINEESEPVATEVVLHGSYSKKAPVGPPAPLQIEESKVRYSKPSRSTRKKKGIVSSYQTNPFPQVANFPGMINVEQSYKDIQAALHSQLQVNVSQLKKQQRSRQSDGLAPKTKQYRGHRQFTMQSGTDLNWKSLVSQLQPTQSGFQGSTGHKSTSPPRAGGKSKRAKPKPLSKKDQVSLYQKHALKLLYGAPLPMQPQKSAGRIQVQKQPPAAGLRFKTKSMSKPLETDFRPQQQRVKLVSGEGQPLQQKIRKLSRPETDSQRKNPIFATESSAEAVHAPQIFQQGGSVSAGPIKLKKKAVLAPSTSAGALKPTKGIRASDFQPLNFYTSSKISYGGDSSAHGHDSIGSQLSCEELISGSVGVTKDSNVTFDKKRKRMERVRQLRASQDSRASQPQEEFQANRYNDSVLTNSKQSQDFLTVASGLQTSQSAVRGQGRSLATISNNSSVGGANKKKESMRASLIRISENDAVRRSGKSTPQIAIIPPQKQPKVFSGAPSKARNNSGSFQRNNSKKHFYQLQQAQVALFGQASSGTRALHVSKKSQIKPFEGTSRQQITRGSQPSMGSYILGQKLPQLSPVRKTKQGKGLQHVKLII